MPEALAPSTTIWSKDIAIISHSKNITSKQLNELIGILFETIKTFLAKENATKTQPRDLEHWAFISNLDQDNELLKRFKETLTKEEQQYLSQLMVHLQTAMQREEVASVGMGAM